MGGQIPIKILPVHSDINPDVVSQIPTQALTDYFSALGYPLDIQIGNSIASRDDPTDSPDEIPDFCNSYAPPFGVSKWPGILLVTDLSIEGSHVNGTLLDRYRRGACAVFTESIDYQLNNESRFEIYVHELGHMLNLSHDDGIDVFPTAMMQSDNRKLVTDRSKIWKQAIARGSKLQRKNSSSYFDTGFTSPLGLPMSAKCCSWLANAPENNILPWNSKFKDSSYIGANDKAFSVLDCRISADSYGSVAQPIDIQVCISAKSIFKEVYVPSAFDLRSGTIEIHITSPFGAVRIYRCRSMTCCTSKQKLTRGRLICRNYTLLGDANGVLFPTAGKYFIEALLPHFGTRSGPLEYSVSKATGPFSQLNFQSFLGNDLPAYCQTEWRIIDEILKSPDITARTKAFLRFKSSVRLHKPFIPIGKMDQDASSRIQERDALLRVIRIRRAHPNDYNKLKRAIDEATDIFCKSDTSNPTIQYLDRIREKTEAFTSKTER